MKRHARATDAWKKPDKADERARRGRVEKQSHKRTKYESRQAHEPPKQSVRHNAGKEDTQLQERTAQNSH